MIFVSITIFLIVLIVIYLYDYNYEHFHSSYLSGFWTGESTFLNESNLLNMSLCISACERLGSHIFYQGYLVIVNTDKTIVSNQVIELKWSKNAEYWMSAIKCPFTPKSADYIYTINNAKFTYDDQPVMPTKMNININVMRGTLALYSNKKIYAFLIKDNTNK